MRETPAYAEAETEAKAKSFIPKYGEIFANNALEVNFTINIWTNFNEIASILDTHLCK